MRKVILQEFVTLDGLAAGVDGSVDFVPAAMAGDQSFGARQLAFIDTLDTILLGRVTYELFANYWPNVTEGDDKAFADRLNAIPKVVFSKTLERAPWGRWADARIVADGAADEVRRLKRSQGGDMVLWGSLSLARSLVADGLIDEYQLVVCPLVLGGGEPLFARAGPPLDLSLLRTDAFDRGSVLLAYRTSPVSGTTPHSTRSSGDQT